MKQFGITGGIGSGKSLVAKIFVRLGIPVYDADKRGKFISDNNPEVISNITQLLGDKAYRHGSLDRTWVASQVFNNKMLLQQLNGIIHPAVGQDYIDWVADQQSPYVLKEAALMFESGSYKQLNGVINVQSPKELRISRVLIRDPQRSRDQVEAIISNQLSEEDRNSRSQYQLINNEKEMLIPQVLELDKLFRSL